MLLEILTPLEWQANSQLFHHYCKHVVSVLCCLSLAKVRCGVPFGPITGAHRPPSHSSTRRLPPCTADRWAWSCPVLLARWARIDEED